MRSAERRGGGRHEPKREERRGSSAAARCGVDGDGLLEIEKEVKHYMEEDELEYGRLWGWGRTNNTSSTASLLPDSLFHTAPRHSVSGEETREREWSSPTGGYVQRGRHKTDHWVTCAGTRPHEFVWHLRDNVGMKSVCVCVCVCSRCVNQMQDHFAYVGCTWSARRCELSVSTAVLWMLRRWRRISEERGGGRVRHKGNKRDGKETRETTHTHRSRIGWYTRCGGQAHTCTRARASTAHAKQTRSTRREFDRLLRFTSPPRDTWWRQWEDEGGGRKGALCKGHRGDN